jgi:RHS repeat-associated protein
MSCLADKQFRHPNYWRGRGGGLSAHEPPTLNSNRTLQTSGGSAVAAGNDTYGWTTLFQGERFDVVSGLYQDGARWYREQLGRFLQQDPAGYVDGANLYQYVGSGPVDHVDPSGLTSRRNYNDFHTDAAGAVILNNWLEGDGSPLFINGNDDLIFKNYMQSNELLRRSLYVMVNKEAKNGLKQDHEFYSSTHQEVENGEAIVGYNLLHGTNAQVHDFEFYGTTELSHLDNGKCVVTVKALYRWNDIIDPNEHYNTDVIKSTLATIADIAVSHRVPHDYNIHITWRETATLVFNADGSFDAASSSGWPIEKRSYKEPPGASHDWFNGGGNPQPDHPWVWSQLP